MEKGGFALVFPGSGAQYVGMGKSLYEGFAVVRRTFEEAGDILDYDFRRLCFEGKIREMNKIRIMLPAIFIVSVAAYRVFAETIGISPRFAAGHSLGEYSALTCSGALRFEDALKIVRLRSELAEEVADKENGVMTIVNGVPGDVADEQCKNACTDTQIVSVACYNSPFQVLISGHQEAVLRVEKLLHANSAKIIPLIGSAPYHSSLMNHAADRLKRELMKYEYREFAWPVISNVAALPYTSPEDIIANLTLQMTKPVQWQAIINYMREQGIREIVEVGPGSVLKNIINTDFKNITAYSLEKTEDIEAISGLLSGSREGTPYGDRKNNSTSTVITMCLADAVSTRNNNFDNNEYEAGVIEPYEKIQSLQDELEKQGTSPTPEQMYFALEMLKQILKTKRVPIDEQIRRLTRILDETGTGGLLKEFEMPLQ